MNDQLKIQKCAAQYLKMFGRGLIHIPIFPMMIPEFAICIYLAAHRNICLNLNSKLLGPKTSKNI